MNEKVQLNQIGKHYATGSKGTEIRNSFKAGWDDGNMGFSLGTNFWDGTGGMSEFKQRTAILSFKKGDFNFSYENDGSPFNLVGKVLNNDTDMFRTAAVGINIGEFGLNMNLFTGKSGTDESGLPFEEAKVDPSLVDFTKGRDYGMWKNSLADKYRLGALTLRYRNWNIGVNSEHVRDVFQNWFAHTIMPGAHQPGFRMLSTGWNPYFNYQTSNNYTLW